LARTKVRFRLKATNGDEVLRILVTGGPPVRGGGGMPHRIMASSRPVSVLRMTGAGKSGNTPVIGGRFLARLRHVDGR